jgi:hypothetical protein
MTPYELRFYIFQHAQAYLIEEYRNKLETSDSVSFPSYEQISNLAEKLNGFVSG